MKSSLRKRIPAICLMATILLLTVSMMQVGCSKKKKDKFWLPPPAPPERPDVGGTVYNAAAAVGDLLSYQINTGTLEYSYAVLKGKNFGDYGNGTLTALGGFGPNVYSTSGNDTIALLPDKFALIGTVDGLLIAGVPEVSTPYNASQIEGYYNYVQYDIEGTDTPGVEWGTIRIDQGTWQAWEYIDGASVPDPPDAAGSWIDKGNGIVDIYFSFPYIKIGYMMVYTSGNDNILVLDQFYEKGMLIGVKQQPATSGDFDGVYDVLDTQGTALDTMTVAGANITGALGSSTIFYNIPWTGMITDGANLAGFFSPNGVFFGVNNLTPGAYYAVGGIKE
ncbi:MAG: hypothetical protein E3J72_14985 [Planctomycetota bacterium]|nr:MAG: hypothetical protein E3J72_14985 [Planctomycetota bacterium]